MKSSLNNVLRSFDSIGLEQIEEYPSMKRIDTKFLFHSRVLPQVLEKASAHFSVLEINDRRIADYRNQYFDTKDLRFYLEHHNGRKNRTKVRLREYVDSGVQFLEIKKENNKGLTTKVRTRLANAAPELTDKRKIFINEHLEDELRLKPSLRNRFSRITLIHLVNQERTTFDFELSFSADSKEARLEHLVIAEVKQYRNDNSSPIIDIFTSLGVTPNGFSKYCIGMASLYQELKQNRFKEKIREIEKITA